MLYVFIWVFGKTSFAIGTDVSYYITIMCDWECFYLKEPEKTAIIAIGFPRYAQVLLDKLEEVKKEGFPINALTDRRLSPLVPIAITVIYLPITVSSIFDFYSISLAFINLILRDASKKILSLDNRLAAIESYNKEHQVFYKIER